MFKVDANLFVKFSGVMDKAISEIPLALAAAIRSSLLSLCATALSATATAFASAGLAIALPLALELPLAAAGRGGKAFAGAAFVVAVAGASVAAAVRGFLPADCSFCSEMRPGACCDVAQ